jgi:hypothetical protein
MNQIIKENLRGFTDDLKHLQGELQVQSNNFCTFINHFQLYFQTLNEEIKNSSQGKVISQVLNNLEINYEQLTKSNENMKSNEETLFKLMRDTNGAGGKS